MSKIKNFFGMLARHDQKSLKTKSIRAAIWTILGRGAGRFIRMVSSIVLTRFLFPEAFGLMATATVIINMVELFADTGVRTSLIQSQKGHESEYLDTAWLISIGRGLVLFGISAGLSFPMAYFYGKPELTWILIAMSSSTIIRGFENPALALVIKKLRAEKQVVYELSTQVLGFCSTVFFAWLLADVWALVIGSLLLSFYRMVGSFIIEDYKPKPRWSKEAGKELFQSGKTILINTMIVWACLNSDKLLVGRLIDMKTLGLYSIGYNIGTVVELMLIQIFSQSYFPAVSSVANNKQRVLKIFRRTSAIVLAIALPVLILSTLFADVIIEVLYDQRYQLAAVPMFWISFRGIFRNISIVQSGTFLALNKLYLETYAMTVGLLATLVLFPCGAIYYTEFGIKDGLTGVSVAFFISGVIISFAESIFLVFGTKFPFYTVFRPWLQIFGVTSVLFIVYFLLKPLFPYETVSNIIFIGLMAIISFAVSGGVLILLEGKNPFKDQGG